jgi:hypothetical protein
MHKRLRKLYIHSQQKYYVRIIITSILTEVRTYVKKFNNNTILFNFQANTASVLSIYET